MLLLFPRGSKAVKLFYALSGNLLAYLHCLDNGRLNRGRGKPSIRKDFSAKS